MCLSRSKKSARFLLFSAVLSLAMSLPALAKEHSYNKKLRESFSEPVFDLSVSEADVKKGILASEKKRKPAATNLLNASMLDASVVDIRDKFFKVSTPEELHEMLTNLNDEEKFKKLSPAGQFLAAQLIPAMAFRGFIYKMRLVFEKRSKGVHSAVLTMAKNTATNFKIYLPSEHMSVVYDYLASPYYEMDDEKKTLRLVQQFADEADIQIWLNNNLKSKIHQAIRRVQALSLVEPVVWDQQFLYGKDSFQDNIGRFRLVGEIEKSLVLAAMWSSVASINVIRSYDLRGAIDLSRDMGKLYGIDGFLGTVDGVSARKITSQILKYPNIGQKHKVEGPILLPRAHEALKNAMVLMKSAWELSSTERRNEDLYGVNTGFWRVNREEFNENLQIMDRVVHSNQTEALRSSVTGEVIEINFANFFNEKSPENMQVFLPQEPFEQKATISRTVKIDGKSYPLTYRNYSEGSPLTWKTESYQKYIPSVKSNEDVLKTLRVLSHAGGNWLALTR